MHPDKGFDKGPALKGNAFLGKVLSTTAPPGDFEWIAEMDRRRLNGLYERCFEEGMSIRDEENKNISLLKGLLGDCPLTGACNGAP